jgi:hypothetical protein
MPLLPAFEGEIGKSGAYAIKAITHYNYTSICKGNQSLWQQLIKEGNFDVQSHSKFNKCTIFRALFMGSYTLL